ncbi:MAG: hypothetical protein JRI68_01620 [Deltaproteobacteria bacterium]|nr:hypothetical protein [Deltaproteobacteria bacterium]
MKPNTLLALAVCLPLLGCPPEPPPVVQPPAPYPLPVPPEPEPTAKPTLPPEAVIHVGTLWQHICLLRRLGEVECWGKNSYGQLGLGHREPSQLPLVPGTGIELTAVATLLDAIAVAAGRDFSCALRNAGTVVCWGNNEDGQLGDGRGGEPAALSLSAVEVAGLQNVKQISLGEYHGCALNGDGAVHCWGNGANGQIGSDAQRAFGTPQPIAELRAVREVASGANHVCALERQGTVKCWGRNTEGQMGDGQRGSRTSPVVVSGIQKAVHIASGHNHSCALLDSGGVRCWGDHKAQQLGPAGGSAPKHGTPVEVTGLGDVVQLAGGALHTCARLRSGRVSCWGANRAGQLGTQPSEEPSSEPTDVPELTQAAHVSLGLAHSCAALQSGQFYCWGAQ